MNTADEILKDIKEKGEAEELQKMFMDIMKMIKAEQKDLAIFKMLKSKYNVNDAKTALKMIKMAKN